jgi:hypothetical protein
MLVYENVCGFIALKRPVTTGRSGSRVRSGRPTPGDGLWTAKNGHTVSMGQMKKAAIRQRKYLLERFKPLAAGLYYVGVLGQHY